jgi:hypothetical protein
MKDVKKSLYIEESLILKSTASQRESMLLRSSIIASRPVVEALITQRSETSVFSIKSFQGHYSQKSKSSKGGLRKIDTTPV